MTKIHPLDPTYVGRDIEANPVWKLAFEMSEQENDNAPIGWGAYIPRAQKRLAFIATVDELAQSELTGAGVVRLLDAVVEAKMSYKPEVIADSSGVWSGNAMRFGSREEAEIWLKDLTWRWMAVRETRVVESADPVNYAIIDGKVTKIDEPKKDEESS